MDSLVYTDYGRQALADEIINGYNLGHDPIASIIHHRARMRAY